jgi:prepilin-type N-terminal cleavage/methylation domain-containing protein
MSSRRAGTKRSRALRGLLAREERGFTLIEVLIAALLTAIGLIAVIGTLDSSRHAVNVAERNETISHQAEQEIERLLTMDYDDLGLNAAVVFVNDDRDPRYYVRSSGTQYQWDRNNTAAVEDLVSSGTLSPSSSWQTLNGSGTRFSGKVWRFVTYYYDPNVVQTPTDEADAKRVIVAVTIDGEGGPTKPVVTSSIVRDRP